MLPLQYAIKRGQSYALADATVPTDYYYAQTYNNSRTADHTVVIGKRTYYEIWFGHRIAYVRARDVVAISESVRSRPLASVFHEVGSAEA